MPMCITPYKDLTPAEREEVIERMADMLRANGIEPTYLISSQPIHRPLGGTELRPVRYPENRHERRRRARAQRDRQRG